MKLIKPTVEIIKQEEYDLNHIFKFIELAGRTCYKSEDKITEDSYEKMLKNIIKRGHTSVLEHEKITVRIICDRGVSHEFVRHRAFSFAQESTRYCNYTKDKFNNELTFIIPCWIKDLKEDNYYAYCEYHHSKNDASKRWFDSCMSSEFVYTNLIEEGWKPQEARTILPNSLKTELIMTGFNGDWQHFFELRCATNAHPQAKELADMLKDKFNK